MLIYEDQEGEQVEKEAKKIINVSFNDFNQSNSNDYSRENSREADLAETYVNDHSHKFK